MGCYGIGINRILASLIETSFDKGGIIWPSSLSPCEVVVIPVNREDVAIAARAEAIYEDLKAEGVDVIIDDRDKSPGVKFKDSDLIGFSYQVVIGKKNFEKGKVEVKNRASGETTLVDLDKVVQHVKGKIADSV